MVEKILKVFKDGEKDGQYPKPTKYNILIKKGKGIYNLDLLILSSYNHVDRFLLQNLNNQKS